jgi:tetratricopeptide (TPR) repeat protein
VRKQIEIPACGTLLLTEESAVLKSAGYRDLENCIFATPKNVIEKVEFALSRMDALQEMIDAGKRLVHDRHTMRSRDQIRQWYDLVSRESTSRRLVQESPFSSISCAPDNRASFSGISGSFGQHLQLIEKGNSLYRNGSFDEAAEHYKRCNAITYGMAEPKLMLAACDLHNGKASAALERIVSLNRLTLGKYDDVTPDPVEWAFLVVCYLCTGDEIGAAQRASQYTSIKHPLLDYLRLLLDVRSSVVMRSCTSGRTTRSVHTFFSEVSYNWAAEVCAFAKSCGQSSKLDHLINRNIQSILLDSDSHRCEIKSPYYFSIRSIKSAITRTKKPLRGFDNPLYKRALVEKFHALNRRIVIRLRNVNRFWKLSGG